MSFTVEKKIFDAHYPRFKGSTISVDDRLKVVYNKYTSTIPAPKDKIRINLTFCHGTGFNKEIWNYHINKLYEFSTTGHAEWYLGSVIAFDAVSHGDSALANEGKIGWTYGWPDGAKDLIKLVKHEQESCNDFLNNRLSRNIAIGHSLGGYAVILAGFYEPELFDTIIPIEPVFMLTKVEYFLKAIRRFGKISQMIIDEFDSLDDFKEYFTKYSITKDFHPKVLNDLIEGEYYEVYCPETKTTKIRSKASKNSQMSTYLCSYFALELSTTVLPLIGSNVFYIWGEKAAWNPQGCEQYFIEHIKKDKLVGYECVKNGTHLLNGELPDDLIKVFSKVIDQRGKAAFEDQDCYPEIKFKGDKKKMMEHNIELLLNSKMEEATHFSKGPLPESRFKL